MHIEEAFHLNLTLKKPSLKPLISQPSRTHTMGSSILNLESSFYWWNLLHSRAGHFHWNNKSWWKNSRSTIYWVNSWVSHDRVIHCILGSKSLSREWQTNKLHSLSFKQSCPFKCLNTKALESPRVTSFQGPLKLQERGLVARLSNGGWQIIWAAANCSGTGWPGIASLLCVQEKCHQERPF